MDRTDVDVSKPAIWPLVLLCLLISWSISQPSAQAEADCSNQEEVQLELKDITENDVSVLRPDAAPIHAWITWYSFSKTAHASELESGSCGSQRYAHVDEED